MQGARGVGVAALTLAMIGVFAVTASSAFSAAPAIGKTKVSSVASSSAVLEAEVNTQGVETHYHFEYGLVDCEIGPCISTVDEVLPGGTSPVKLKAPVTGLTPAAVYHFRIVTNNGEEARSPDRIFATYASPLIGSSDGRAYEQSSPVDKGSGDAEGDIAQSKAAADGNGITFGSTFGVPGGKGAKALPTYLAKRGAGGLGWTTQGLLPPASTGERVVILGWSPDFTEVFSSATKLGTPNVGALLVQSTGDGALTEVAPYTANATYFYVGQSPAGSVVFFESKAKLTAEAREGSSNLYAWDRASAQISLADMLNDQTAPIKGAFAGSYDWGAGTNGRTLSEGGAARNYYLEEEHAISARGDVFFTEAGTGQLYLRLNPTRPQSAMEGDACLKPADACTIRVSASKKTDGESLDGADPAGPQPAAFQAASADGSEVFFTSSEKLTNDANTGPEQPEAAIGLGDVETGALEDDRFIPKHAIGVAVDSKYVYWADPSLGTIGRAELDGDPASVEPNFIAPGPVDFEVSPGVHEPIESTPRYVAVDAGHVYWTNSGRIDAETVQPLDETGTIGRADIEGSQSSIEADFITGASNPQGIAVNASHIYWANAGNDLNQRTIGMAETGGGGVEQKFFEVKSNGKIPFGVALSDSHVYFSANEEENDSGSIRRIPLDSGTTEFVGIGKAKIRGVAVDATHVYWATQGEEAIGRLAISDFPEFGPCEAIISCDKKFTPIEGALDGLAVNAEHLYWSINGEASTNPGNDLYRFLPATKTLEDLTPLGAVGTDNGAEVQGLVGAAADGSRIYFVANGDLDGPGGASSGNCQTTVAHGSIASTSGHCSLYALQEGSASLVARLDAGGGGRSDALDWAPTPREVFAVGADYKPKTAFASPDGQSLLFRSQEKLSAYENEGAPELYRYRVGDPAIRCASCAPSGEAATEGPSLGSVTFPSVGPAAASHSPIASRNFSANGERAFFETPEALSPLDTNGLRDVYEWEAPGTGSCQGGGESYSPLNAGCVYLLSTGKDKFPSFFADASESGDDVFFFTRQQLVGQDKDELQDVYDARVGGGLASQNPPPPQVCPSAEACHGPAQPPPVESTPATPIFVGPGNPAPKHKKKARKHKHKKHHAKKHKKAKNKGRAGR